MAHPVLPTRPALPTTVDPDQWLQTLDGRRSPRLVKKDGRIQVDGSSYYIKASLAGQHIMLHLNASTRHFDVFLGEQFVKSVPIKGLLGEPMPSFSLHRSDARTGSFGRTPTLAPTTTSAPASWAECLSINVLRCIGRLHACFPDKGEFSSLLLFEGCFSSW